MSKSRVFFIAACLAALAGEQSFAAIRPQDRDNVRETGLPLDATDDKHVRAWKSATPAQRNDYGYYEALGLLPPRGGAPHAAAAGGIGGLFIDYTDEDSMRDAAPIILRSYRLPPRDDLYIAPTVHLLRMHHRIPTKNEIEREYDARLTPFVRTTKSLVDNIDSKSMHEVNTEFTAAINALPPEALNLRTVAGSADAQAAIAYMKTLLDQQIRLLKGHGLAIIHTPQYENRGYAINILYGGNLAFQHAASSTFPAMTDVLGASFTARSHLIHQLQYDAVMSDFAPTLAKCKGDQFFPLIEILMLPPPASTATSADLASRLLDRMEPTVITTMQALITRHLPHLHAGAILSLLLKNKEAESIFRDLDKFIDQKPQEVQKKARAKYGVLEALSKRSDALDPTKKINGPGGRADLKKVMDNLELLLQNAVKYGER